MSAGWEKWSRSRNKFIFAFNQRRKSVLGPLFDSLVISSDGNLLDALGAAIKAALTNTAIPKVNVSAEVADDEQPEIDISDEEYLQSTNLVLVSQHGLWVFKLVLGTPIGEIEYR